MKKTGYRTADEIVTNMALPVLGVVPDMQVQPHRHGHRRRARMIVTVMFAVITIVIIGVAVAKWML